MTHCSDPPAPLAIRSQVAVLDDQDTELLSRPLETTRRRSSDCWRISTAASPRSRSRRPWAGNARRLRFLETLVLPESARRRLDSTLVLIADFTRKIERTTHEIDTRASDDPHFEVLCQIRGVDRYIAMLVSADVGDVSRLRARAISAPGPG